MKTNGQHDLSRRDFMVAAAGGLAAGLAGCRTGAPAARTGQPFAIELGVCQPADRHELIKAAGFAYIEDGVSRALMPGDAEAAFDKRRQELGAASLPVRACNGFFPGNLAIVGPAPNTDELLAWAETALRRAEVVGIRHIVFGSGRSRRIPDGFEPARARDQFVAFCRQLGPIAGAHNVVIVLEPLNRGETNFFNSVEEGIGLVDDTDHPNIRLLADFYHMLRENEGPDAILKAGARLRHCHVAENKDRAAPGTNGEDFRPYLAALKTIGYRGGLSAECRWKKLEDDLPMVHRTLREQIASL